MDMEEKKQRKRMEGLFRARKVLGRNDILVDTATGKIKVELPTNNAIIKREVVEPGPGNDSVTQVQVPEGEQVSEEEPMNEDSAEVEAGPYFLVKGEEPEVDVTSDDEEAESENDSCILDPHIVSLSSLAPSEPLQESQIEVEEIEGRNEPEVAVEESREDDGEFRLESSTPNAGTENSTVSPSKKKKHKDDSLSDSQVSAPTPNLLEPSENEDWLDDLIGAPPTTEDIIMMQRIQEPRKLGNPVPAKNSRIQGKRKRSTKVKVPKDTQGTGQNDAVTVTDEIASSSQSQSRPPARESDEGREMTETSTGSREDIKNDGSYFVQEEIPIQFDTSESIEMYLAKASDLQNNNRNDHPFTRNRSVVIKTPINSNDTNLTHFWESLHSLFSKHGNLIWNLSLEVAGSYSVALFYKWIKQLLSQMPNLRSLDINYHPGESQQLFSVTDSLPTLQYLESLNFGNAMLPMVANYVFLNKYSSSLKKLEINLQAWDEETAAEFTKLTELSITQVNSKTALGLNPCIKSLQKNPSVCRELAMLTLSLEVTVLANELFGMLKPFKRLKDLKLVLAESQEYSHLEVAKRMEAKKSLPPRLPSIKSFTISLNLSQRSFGFLKWLPCLESLHLEEVSPSNYGLVQNEKADDVDMELRRCLARNSAMKSKIWTLLPSVKLITVRWSPGFEVARGKTSFQRELCQ